MEIGSAQHLFQYFRVKETSVSVGATAAEVAKGDSTRISLRFYGPTASACYVSTLSTVTVGKGIEIINTIVPLELSFHDAPGLVQLPWYAIGGGAVVLTVIEIFEQPPSFWFGDEIDMELK